MVKTIQFGFNHGLGDMANYAHVLALYVRRGYRVEVQCDEEKACLARAAGCVVVPRAGLWHHFPHWPHPGPPCLAEPWRGNKVAHNMLEPPLPAVAERAELWRELCTTELQGLVEVPEESRRALDALIAELPRPLFLLHSKANSLAGDKDLDESTTFDLYHELLDRTEGSLILLDWDRRVPRCPNWRIRHLEDDLRRLGVAELVYLIEQADLLLGVDSGPLHVARYTHTPAIGLWRNLYAGDYAIPRRRTVHLVHPRHAHTDRFRRHHFQTCLLPDFNGRTIADYAVRYLAASEDRAAATVMLHNYLARTRSRGGALAPIVDRDQTFRRALDRLRALGRPVVIVETGTIRAEEDWGGAGFSTYLFGHFVQHFGGELHSIDLDPRNCAFAREWTTPFAPHVHVHQGKGVDALRQYAELLRPAEGGSAPGIDLLLLDSMDTERPEHAVNCLDELVAALPALREGAQILIDDTVYTGGQWKGKGALAVPALLERGWHIVYAGYQALLAR